MPDLKQSSILHVEQSRRDDVEAARIFRKIDFTNGSLINACFVCNRSFSKPLYFPTSWSDKL